MDKLNEHQINEGVVYQQNGIGQPKQRLIPPQSRLMMSSMVTTSTSAASQKFKFNENQMIAN